MSDEHATDAAAQARRGFLLAAAMAGVGTIGTSARAGPLPPGSRSNGGPDRSGDEILDHVRIADLVQRERAARDAGQWDEMASLWHPQSTVDVSWFKGDGAAFVAASRRNGANGRISVHQLAPTVVEVKGSRAIAETPCQLVSFVPLEGIDICMVGTVRLLWRAQPLAERWHIAGLRMIYIRDCIIPCDPNRVPPIDAAELARYRASYRFLSYVLARSPNQPRDDLPGIDRPESVEALRAGETRWLTENKAVDS